MIQKMEAEKGEFKCACCGACCRWEGMVRVGDDEIRAIAGFLHLDEQEFIDKYTTIARDRRTLVLIEAPDGACCFLSKDNLCRINPVKPKQCGTFPKEWGVPPELMKRCQGHWEPPR